MRSWQAKARRMAMMVGVALAAQAWPALASKTVTVGTAGVMGVYYPLGGALCRMVNVTRKVHKLRCSVEPSEGSVSNIKGVLAGDLDMGIAQSDTQFYAQQGQGAFAGKPQSKLRVLFNVYPESLTLMAREDSGIRRVEDLKGKRVSLGTAGSGTRVTADLVLNAVGVRREDLKAALEMKIVEMAPALCDGKMDAFVFVAGHPNPVLQDAASGCRTRVVPITGPQVDALLAARPYYTRVAIPASTYKGMDSAQSTLGTVASIVVSSDMPDDVAYAITRAVFESFDDFRRLHPALAGLTKEQAAKGSPIATHPGAMRYFKEVGLQ